MDASPARPRQQPVAQDTVVSPPYHIQWVGDPDHSRSHQFLTSVSAMVSAVGGCSISSTKGPPGSRNTCPPNGRSSRRTPSTARHSGSGRSCRGSRSTSGGGFPFLRTSSAGSWRLTTVFTRRSASSVPSKRWMPPRAQPCKPVAGTGKTGELPSATAACCIASPRWPPGDNRSPR